jgi:hypothetical protein
VYGSILTLFAQVFYAAVATAGLSIIGSAILPWYSVKGKAKAKEGDASGGENEPAAGVAVEGTGVMNQRKESTDEK